MQLHHQLQGGMDKEGSRGQGQGQGWLFGKLQGDRAAGGQMLGDGEGDDVSTSWAVL